MMDASKLTFRQKVVLSVLTDDFEQPGIIANLAHIHTTSPRETASKFCIQLTNLGFAEKGGTPKFPKWRRTQEK